MNRTKNGRYPATLRSSFKGDDRGDGVSLLTRSTVIEWYGEKHRAPSHEEIALINSCPILCPYSSDCPAKEDGCEGRIVRNGRRKDGVQKLKCGISGKSFTPLSGTIFDGRKIPISEWVEYLLNLASYESVRQASLTNANADSTGEYWLMKAFLVLDGCQDGVRLSGEVWLDETYFHETPKGMVLVDGKRLRGISRNCYCVACARDSRGNLLIVPCGKGKPTAKRILGIFRDRIERGSLLIHDGENSHGALVKELSLKEDVYPSKATKGMRDSLNPMDRINEVHRMLKKFMSRHGGFGRDKLAGWLNLFWLIFTRNGDLQRVVNDFIRMAISCRKTLKYRDAFK